MISIEASSIRRMFEQVTPHMEDAEDGIPVISSVRLEARNGWLYAAATDRFTFAVSRRPVVVVEDGNRAGHLPGGFVAAVSAWLDAAAEAGLAVTLSLPLEGRSAPLTFEAPGRGKLTVDYDAGDFKNFPNWRTFLRPTLTAEPVSVPVTGFTTRFLARWQHAAERLTAWQQGPNKPVVLLDELGYFAGLHMPVRQEGLTREGVADEWIEATAHTATVDGITYDLSKTWEDRDGDSWTYSGDDTPDGMPLMVIDGIEENPYPLDRLIAQYGPLHAV
ncbi:phiSA1p31-related protein [Streptomyces sp. NPDC056738]|uniref:phiSA1p31-related protein n=1 Tax=Streptomyces sp. NPDC056738 TaxID=3345933 RepID=UPI00367ED109